VFSRDFISLHADTLQIMQGKSPVKGAQVNAYLAATPYTKQLNQIIV
jgi:hypothetical protein